MAKNKIFTKLLELQKNSYCAYSHYPVAAILVDQAGHEYEGVNMENATYGLTICAERNAIAHAVAQGVREFKEIHIICGDNKKTFGLPCGACLQVINEFCHKDMPVIIWNCEGESKVYTLGDLLPYSFNNEYLGKE